VKGLKGLVRLDELELLLLLLELLLEEADEAEELAAAAAAAAAASLVARSIACSAGHTDKGSHLICKSCAAGHCWQVVQRATSSATLLHCKGQYGGLLCLTGPAA